MKEFEKWDNTQCCESQDGELCEKISSCCACTEVRKQAWRAALEWALEVASSWQKCGIKTEVEETIEEELES